MKKWLIMVLVLAFYGCSDNDGTARQDLQACQKMNTELQQQLVEKTQTSEEAQRQADAWAEVLRGQNQQEHNDPVLAILTDALADEQLVADYVTAELESIQTYNTRFEGAIYGWEEKIPTVLKNSAIYGTAAEPMPKAQQQLIGSYLEGAAKSVLNNKYRLARYYKAFKQPVLLSILDYQQRKFHDNYSTLDYLEKVRQGFVDLLKPEKFQEIENLLKTEAELDNLDWETLSETDRQVAQEKRTRLDETRANLQNTLFAYRRYSQSGNDKKLIELYIKCFDDFLSSAKSTDRERAETNRKKKGLIAFGPGWYVPGTNVIEDPYDWFALYRTETGLVLKKTDLKITKAVNEAGGIDVLDIGTPDLNEPLVIMRGANWLTEGPVQTLLDNAIYAHFSNGSETKPAYVLVDKEDAFMLEIVKTSAPKSSAEDNSHTNLNYNLNVSTSGKKQEINYKFDISHTSFHVDWVGDLDRDGIPDFMITAGIEDKSFSYRFLYLSGSAKKGEMYNTINVADPDGEGC